ncbi:MAG: hypothetical protein HY608_01240 [Planctomycetes bacterium]|nr:hypothetical protein [Planctomycetota bacterium]
MDRPGSDRPPPGVPILGIDEAGRGPILGPMVLAGVYADEAGLASMREAGVADSKKFAGKRARERRATLADVVRANAIRTAMRVVPVERIDAESLGDIERDEAMSIIRQIRPEGEVILDGAAIFDRLARRLAWGRAEDRADAAHTAVAAASILAKVERDRLFLEIAARYEPEYGPLAGWGYNTAGSYAFLEAYHARTGGCPPEMRRKWGWLPATPATSPRSGE